MEGIELVWCRQALSIFAFFEANNVQVRLQPPLVSFNYPSNRYKLGDYIVNI